MGIIRYVADACVKRSYKPITNAKRAGTDGAESIGLGLAISRQIVEAHNGKVGFESEPNTGTSFYIEFPI